MLTNNAQRHPALRASHHALPRRAGMQSAPPGCPRPRQGPGRREGQPVFPGQAPGPGQKARSYLQLTAVATCWTLCLSVCLSVCRKALSFRKHETLNHPHNPSESYIHSTGRDARARLQINMECRLSHPSPRMNQPLQEAAQTPRSRPGLLRPTALAEHANLPGPHGRPVREDGLLHKTGRMSARRERAQAGTAQWHRAVLGGSCFCHSSKLQPHHGPAPLPTARL